MTIANDIIKKVSKKKLHFSLLDPDKQRPDMAGSIAETVEEAGERELLEETNLKGRPGRLLGIYLQKSCTYEYIMVVGVEFFTDSDNPTPGDDASEVAYFSKESLPEIPFKSHSDLITAFYS